MKGLFFLSCICMQLMVLWASSIGSEGIISISNNGNAKTDLNLDKEQLVQDLITFLKPYQSELQQWFWQISGNPYNSPYFNQSSKLGTMAEYITCEICVPALPLVKLLVTAGFTTEDIVGVITIACQLLNLAPMPEVCGPTISAYATPILYMVINKPEIPNNDFCGIINPGCVDISEHLKNWEIDIKDRNEELIKKPKSLPEVGLPAQTPLTKILQFTDVHIDLGYTEGMNSNCGLPSCCRSSNGQPDSPNNAAGKWGHFSCEMAPDGLKAMFKHAAELHSDTKLIFLTGDYIHSNIWEYGVEENSRHHEAVTSWLQEAFESIAPEIYPLVGNHEPDVVNMYPPEEVWSEFPLRWMYSSVGKAFGDFLPSDQMELFLKYGYYTVTSKADPNMRIIALNTNLCYINNFWLPYEPIDTSGQLQWFADRLHEAELEGQSVLLLGHIYPGSGSCWPVWSRQFERIIQRYSAVIRAQWYGHSHEQDYHITFNGLEPISTGITGGSGVTDGMNPGYNVYYADGERGEDSSWEIVNHQTFVMELVESNARPDTEPAFSMILDSKAQWGLESLNPKEVHAFIYRMVCDDELFLDYQKVVTKGADSPRFNPCLRNDYRCKANVLGGLFVSNSGDYQHRDRLQNYIMNVNCKAESTTTGDVSTTPSNPDGTSSTTSSNPDGTSTTTQKSSASKALPRLFDLVLLMAFGWFNFNSMNL